MLKGIFVLFLVSVFCQRNIFISKAILTQSSQNYLTSGDNFSIRELPDAYMNHQFFIANISMSKNIYNYFLLLLTEDPSDSFMFISKFLFGDYLDQADRSWEVVANKMNIDFKQEEQKYLPEKANFIFILRNFIRFFL